MDSVLQKRSSWARCQTQSWILTPNNEACRSSSWTMKPWLSTGVYSGTTGQQKWKSQMKEFLKQSSSILSAAIWMIASARERKGNDGCAFTFAVSCVVTLQRTNSISQLLSCFSPSSSSPFHHPALLLDSSQEEATVAPIWPEAKERSESLLLPQDSTDLCSYFS